MNRGEGSEHEASRAFKSQLFSQIDGINSSSSGTMKSNNRNEGNDMVMVLATTNRYFSEYGVHPNRSRCVYENDREFAHVFILFAFSVPAILSKCRAYTHNICENKHK